MAEQIGIIEVLQGNAYAVTEDGERELHKGDPVYEDDVIRTSYESALEIRFADNTILSQGADSQIFLDEYAFDSQVGTGELLFKMGEGTFRTITGKIAAQNPEGFNMETPLSTIGIRGTTWFVIVDNTGEIVGVEKMADGHIVEVQTGIEYMVIDEQNDFVAVDLNGDIIPPQNLTPEILSRVQTLISFDPQRQEQDGGEQDEDEQDGDDGGDDGDGDNGNGDDGGDGGEGDDGEEGQDDPLGDQGPQSLIPGLAPPPLVPKGQTGSMKPGPFKGMVAAFLASHGGGGEDPGEPAQTPETPVGDGDTLDLSNPAQYTQAMHVDLNPVGPPNHPFLMVKGGAVGTDDQAVSATVDNIVGTNFAAGDNLFGNDNANSIDGNGGADSIKGEGGADDLDGGAGDDTIEGGTGNDTITGSAGNDVIKGDGGTDFLSYSSYGVAINVAMSTTDGQGTVLVGGGDTQNFQTIERGIGTQYNDTFTGNLGNLNAVYFEGQGGNDTIKGGQGDDTFFGGDGVDTIDGYLGNDFIDGGDGNDTITGSAGNDTIKGGTGQDTLDGSTGSDSIEGGADNDTIYGGSENDTIWGGSGNDLIDGEDGNDYVDGGIGDDTILGNAGLDTLYGADGNDSISGGGDNDSIDGEAGQDTIQGGAGNDSLYGGADNDTIDGQTENDYIDGGTGDDSLLGDIGQDTIYGNTGNDTVIGGGDNDSLHGDAGNDSILGDAGNDTIWGGAGNDTIFGGTGDDNIDAGDDNDTVDMDVNLTSADTIAGGSGTDNLEFRSTGGVVDNWLDNVTQVENVTLKVSAQETKITTVNSLVEANKTVTVDGSALTQKLSFDGTAENDGHFSVTGGSAGDSIIGGELADTINGGMGDDTLEGGDGADLINGGVGDDLFYYSETADGDDTVSGFSSGHDEFGFKTANFAGFSAGTYDSVNDYDTAANYAGDSLANHAYFIWDTATNQLIYDPDGSVAGGEVVIADVNEQVQGADITVS